jgi:glycosyltransferase involved in cell wall biosynthesis
MNVVHLMASPFVGGPERQALGLARALLPDCRTTFLSFRERGLSEPFLNLAHGSGFEAVALEHNASGFWRAAAEIAGHLRRAGAGVLLCSGYKPDVIGWLAARRARVPAVAIAHGWTAATLKVRLNELLDRMVMRHMDAVVGVSSAQAERCRRAGVSPRRLVVIRNAVDPAPFDRPDPAARAELLGLFPSPPERVVVSAGRLSPEKGFEVLIDAAARVVAADGGTGFVVFGDGPLRGELAAHVAARGAGLQARFVLAGFRADVARFLPQADLAVLSSHTEGLPVMVLEAMAARLPVVATRVGGTPEVVIDGVTGDLVPPGDPAALAECLRHVLANEPRRRDMGRRGRERVDKEFTFARQAEQYRRLFERLVGA